MSIKQEFVTEVILEQFKDTKQHQEYLQGIEAINQQEVNS